MGCLVGGGAGRPQLEPPTRAVLMTEVLNANPTICECAEHCAQRTVNYRAPEYEDK